MIRRYSLVRVGIATLNDYLWQKIRLALPRDVECIRLSETASEDLDIYVWDCDTLGDSQIPSAVTVGREGCSLTSPLSFEDISSLLDKAESAPPLGKGTRCAYLRGERIQLTDVEYTLFDILYSANGEFVSREELLCRVWGDATDSVLNVYIHYLREKLERGEKIILSSRKYGYKIDGRFLSKS